MVTRQPIVRQTKPLPLVQKEAMGPSQQRWGEQELGRGGRAHLLHLVVFILICFLTVFLLEFCPLFEGLLLWAAQERRGGRVRGPHLSEKGGGVGEASPAQRSEAHPELTGGSPPSLSLGRLQ